MFEATPWTKEDPMTIKFIPDFLKIFLNHKNNDSRNTYTFLSKESVLGKHSMYFNLGYWENASSDDYDLACEALANQLALKSGLGANDKILDVGFGFGDQDIYWKNKYKVAEIHGINITDTQVDIAAQRITTLGLQQVIHLKKGDATCIEFPENTFDKVMSLESAFHYDTRETFFRESLRVLKPGGIIAIADIIPMETSGIWPKFYAYVTRSFWQIPSKNWVTASDYKNQIAKTGFTNIQMTSIREQVFKPFAQYTQKRLDDEDIKKRFNPLLRIFWKISMPYFGKNTVFDYVIITAEK